MKTKLMSDLGGVLGAIFMALFIPLAAWRWFETGSLFFALLIWRDLTMSYFLLKRNPASRTSFGLPVLLAYFSTVLPLCYQAPGTLVGQHQLVGANLFFIVGF